MSSLNALTGRPGFRAAVVLGSGLGSAAGRLATEGSLPFEAVPGLGPTTVEGHEGALHWGDVDETPTLVFAGRLHLYEGHDPGAVVAPIDLAVEAGCEVIVLTNAAGGINPLLDIGAPCLISDHLNLTGTNPLRGPHDDRGPRFLDLSNLYDPGLRALAREIDPSLQEGVYAAVAGPTYETPAEIRMLATIGADLVGMSTALEAIRAHYLGTRVLGISVVTNAAAGLTRSRLHHEEVARAGRAASGRVEDIVRGVLARLPSL